MGLRVDYNALVDHTENGEKLIAQFDDYIMFSGEIKTYGPLLTRAGAMLDLLEKALPAIEAEADRRDEAMQRHGEHQCVQPYWTEMRELANEMSAEIDRARGKGVSDG